MIRRFDRNWPYCFPEGCPPDTSSEIDMDIYRLCKSTEGPTYEDFICDSVDPDKVQRREGKKLRQSEIIMAKGISVFDDLDAAKSMLSSMYMRNRYKSVARGEGRHGFSKQQGQNQNHFIWWAYADISPMTHFEVVRDGNE